MYIIVKRIETERNSLVFSDNILASRFLDNRTVNQNRAACFLHTFGYAEDVYIEQEFFFFFPSMLLFIGNKQRRAAYFSPRFFFLPSL